MAKAEPRLRSRVTVSDHALLRWLERAKVLDVEAVRAMLEASLERAFAAGSGLGAARFSIVADGLIYLVRGDTIVTVLVDEGQGTHVKALNEPRGQGSVGER